MSEKQSVLGRVTALARTDVAQLIDDAADPERLFLALGRAFSTTIAEAEDALATAVAAKRLTEHDRAEDQQVADDWGVHAATAAYHSVELRVEGNMSGAAVFDDLARTALERQLTTERTVADSAGVVAALASYVDTLREQLDLAKDGLALLEERRAHQLGHVDAPDGRALQRDVVNVLDPDDEVQTFEDKLLYEDERETTGVEGTSYLDARFTTAVDPRLRPEIERRLELLRPDEDELVAALAARASAEAERVADEAERRAADAQARAGDVELEADDEVDDAAEGAADAEGGVEAERGDSADADTPSPDAETAADAPDHTADADDYDNTPADTVAINDAPTGPLSTDESSSPDLAPAGEGTLADGSRTAETADAADDDSRDSAGEESALAATAREVLAPETTDEASLHESADETDADDEGPTITDPADLNPASTDRADLNPASADPAESGAAESGAAESGAADDESATNPPADQDSTAEDPADTIAPLRPTPPGGRRRADVPALGPDDERPSAESTAPDSTAPESTTPENVAPEEAASAPRSETPEEGPTQPEGARSDEPVGPTDPPARGEAAVVGEPAEASEEPEDPEPPRPLGFSMSAVDRGPRINPLSGISDPEAAYRLARAQEDTRFDLPAFVDEPLPPASPDRYSSDSSAFAAGPSAFPAGPSAFASGPTASLGEVGPTTALPEVSRSGRNEDELPTDEYPAIRFDTFGSTAFHEHHVTPEAAPEPVAHEPAEDRHENPTEGSDDIGLTEQQADDPAPQGRRRMRRYFDAGQAHGLPTASELAYDPAPSASNPPAPASSDPEPTGAEPTDPEPTDPEPTGAEPTGAGPPPHREPYGAPPSHPSFLDPKLSPERSEDAQVFPLRPRNRPDDGSPGRG